MLSCRFIRSLLLGAALISPVIITGCAEHVSAGYRVYDPYYGDYHVWSGEDVYYRRWEAERHYDHKDFKKQSKDRQKEYWTWRHSQHEH